MVIGSISKAAMVVDEVIFLLWRGYSPPPPPILPSDESIVCFVVDVFVLCVSPKDQKILSYAQMIEIVREFSSLHFL
jgi:hypothetical protein